MACNCLGSTRNEYWCFLTLLESWTFCSRGGGGQWPSPALEFWRRQVFRRIVRILWPAGFNSGDEATEMSRLSDRNYGVPS
jgi:hypothetical protein